MAQCISYRDFTADKVTCAASATRKHSLLYDGQSNTLIQLPKGVAPFGLSKWDGMYGPQHTINIDVRDANFIEQWKGMEAAIAKSFQSYEMVSCLKNNDRSMRLDVDMHEDAFTGLIVDANSNACDISALKKGDEVICLGQLAHVWTSQKGKIGFKVQVVQMKVFTRTRMQDTTTCLMQGDDTPAMTPAN